MFYSRVSPFGPVCGISKFCLKLILRGYKNWPFLAWHHPLTTDCEDFRSIDAKLSEKKVFLQAHFVQRKINFEFSNEIGDSVNIDATVLTYNDVDG